MSSRIDLKGYEFNELIVHDFSHVSNTHAYWNVECTICGFEKTVSAANLINGNSAHCNKCSRWSLPYKTRLAIASDYQDGIKNNDIIEKHTVCRSTIYKIIKDFGIKADRNTYK